MLTDRWWITGGSLVNHQSTVMRFVIFFRLFTADSTVLYATLSTLVRGFLPEKTWNRKFDREMFAREKATGEP